jgi:hypothetical protein
MKERDRKKARNRLGRSSFSRSAREALREKRVPERKLRVFNGETEGSPASSTEAARDRQDERRARCREPR